MEEIGKQLSDEQVQLVVSYLKDGAKKSMYDDAVEIEELYQEVFSDESAPAVQRDLVVS